MNLIRKATYETADVAESERKAAFVVSTAAEDRDGDTVSPDGWDLSSYRRNPVVLWAHDTKQPPVAMSVRESVSGGALRSVAKFPEPGVYGFADTIFGLVKGGFIRGTSVGFKPLDATPRPQKGIAYRRQELMEYSILPVPSNRDALVEAKAAGIDIADVVKWAEMVIEKSAGSGLWIPTDVIKAAVMGVRPAQVVVPKAWAPASIADAAGAVSNPAALAAPLGLSIEVKGGAKKPAKNRRKGISEMSEQDRVDGFIAEVFGVQKAPPPFPPKKAEQQAGTAEAPPTPTQPPQAQQGQPGQVPPQASDNPLRDALSALMKSLPGALMQTEPTQRANGLKAALEAFAVMALAIDPAMIKPPSPDGDEQEGQTEGEEPAAEEEAEGEEPADKEGASKEDLPEFMKSISGLIKKEALVEDIGGMVAKAVRDALAAERSRLSGRLAD